MRYISRGMIPENPGDRWPQAKEGAVSLSSSFVCTLTLSAWLCAGLTPVPASAGEFHPASRATTSPSTGIFTPSQPEPATQEKPLWHYGGFIDLGYSLDFNFPDNHLFRNRSTTPRVNELDLNMAAVYVRKDPTSRLVGGRSGWSKPGRTPKRSGSPRISPKYPAPMSGGTSGARMCRMSLRPATDSRFKPDCSTVSSATSRCMPRTTAITRAPGSPTIPPT